MSFVINHPFLWTLGHAGALFRIKIKKARKNTSTDFPCNFLLRFPPHDPLQKRFKDVSPCNLNKASSMFLDSCNHILKIKVKKNLIEKEACENYFLGCSRALLHKTG